MLNVSEDIQFQIECFSTELVEMLMQKYGWDMKKALDELYSSETYKRLCNPDCGLYYEGSVYVFSYLENEIETGVVCWTIKHSLVVDYFHVVKLMNERIGQLRRQLWYAEKDVNKRKVIKGTRWILLRNGNDIFDAKYKTRLDNVLNLNEPLMIA